MLDKRWRRRLALACIFLVPTLAGAADVVPLTLDDALEAARQQSPSAASARASVDVATGELRSARRIVSANPEVLVAASPSRVPTIAELEITQQIGVTGQRFARAAASRSDLEAARDDARDVGRLLDIDVAEAFFVALAWEERVVLAEEDAALSRELLAIAATRGDRGADAPLAYELARIRSAEAERGRIDAQAERRASAVWLAAVIGQDPAIPVDPVGDLATTAAMPTLAALVASALEHRPDVARLQHEVDAARARRQLALTSSFPDLTIGARYEADYYDAPVWVALVGISPPLFDQNNGGRSSARAAEVRAESELEGLLLLVNAEIRSAWERWDAARQSVAVYDAEVLAAHDESLRMLTKAYEAGKLDFSEVAIGRRERLESRLAYIDARLDLAVADAELRAAASLPIRSTTGGSR
jgi:cobalt-zinc-cadmium efflux system outer membrane protein